MQVTNLDPHEKLFPSSSVAVFRTSFVFSASNVNRIFMSKGVYGLHASLSEVVFARSWINCRDVSLRASVKVTGLAKRSTHEIPEASSSRERNALVKKPIH